MDEPRGMWAAMRREWKWWALPPLVFLAGLALVLWLGRGPGDEPFMYIFF